VHKNVKLLKDQFIKLAIKLGKIQSNITRCFMLNVMILIALFWYIFALILFDNFLLSNQISFVNKRFIYIYRWLWNVNDINHTYKFLHFYNLDIFFFLSVKFIQLFYRSCLVKFLNKLYLLFAQRHQSIYYTRCKY